jgi:hypothetical protein
MAERIYVQVPRNTPDVDGSVIVQSGFVEDGRKRIAYFVRNGNVGSLGGVEVPGYVIGESENRLGNTQYSVSPIEPNSRTQIEALLRQKGLSQRIIFW